ncbi:hypothetical protein K1T71_004481 [Dendrolimus kikuchii]|uniref:Uncharacterized protein n=1 Tax=Dendrolimus kikuchii TaxID=765133 RepID=A0ACC1D7S7_9NEOP|nr:hypothetical protein K1T71_004481 [Dendrolimus kikuchii]
MRTRVLSMDLRISPPMCEWLSYGDWCDVKLLCGGRAFNAHRAVLASVSGFLREILLSSTTDDLLTFIVLPDFDFEAMSSVLYYIYNGEVNIPKHKVDMFLDIIKAMQIYVDYNNLYQFLDGCNDVPIDLNVNTGHIVCLPPRSIFTLGIDDCKDESFITLKKVKEAQDTMVHYFLSTSDRSDKLCQDGSDRRQSCLGNLKSSYGDRQRSSFLRDLYIETYPRNGNANGLTTSVLAISNEYYRAPASLLLANANEKHLNADGILSETNKNQLNLADSSVGTPNFCRELSLNRNTDDNCDVLCHRNMPNYPHVACSEISKTNNHINSLHWMNSDVTQTNVSLLELRFQEQLLRPNKSSIDVRVMHPSTNYNDQDSNNVPIAEDSIVVKLSNKTIKSNSTNDLNINNCTKVLNHVLESPWCPRVPNNYRPFRKKLINVDEESKQVRELKDISDSNNNIEKIVPQHVTKSELTNSTNSFKEQVLSFVSPIKHESFKCIACNQVFTSDEALTVHKKRHSTSARYACGECGKTFSQLRNFKYHMSIHRGTREFAATCTVCGKYFNDRGYLSSHMKIHRNRKEYKCSLCPKSFNQRVAYNMHVRIHTGVKPHVCEECGKAFSRKMLLKQHQRTHSGERPYACPHCDKRFADRSNMTLHLRLHTGIKPFSCSLCPKSFTKKHHLKSHLNFHTGSKPYSCPRCKLAFTQSSNMRTHLKKCSAPEPESSDTQSSSTM